MTLPPSRSHESWILVFDFSLGDKYCKGRLSILYLPRIRDNQAVEGCFLEFPTAIRETARSSNAYLIRTTELACLDEAQRNSGRVQCFLGFVVLLHRYDYISLFLPCFDIPVSLSSLFQQIAFIDDRSYLPRLNQPFEEGQVFDFVGAI